jgi:nicotinate phosphoribosyltransferase
MGKFHTASDEDILAGNVTDIYFSRTIEILQKKNIHRSVVMELRAASFPNQWPWAVFAGLEETLLYLEGIQKPIDFYSIDEGTIFRPGDPVGYIIGDYQDICVYETALLGFLCQATGIATRSARCVKAADGRPVLSFGTRRVHPSIAPMVDRNAFVGGCVGYSNTATAKLLSGTPSGTIPHALILLVGDTVEATKYFHEIIDSNVARVSLIDTFQDEKFEALRVAEGLRENLSAIRLDTPSSRRGDFLALMKEIRWELDLRGFHHVKIIASGGLNEYTIPELNPCCNGYGVGTSISNSPVVDFALDIVEMDGQPISKRGKYSSRKHLLPNNESLLERQIIPYQSGSSASTNDMIQCKITQGKCVVDFPSIEQLQKNVIDQLNFVTLEK